MKKAKKIFIVLVLTAIFCITTTTSALGLTGVSVFLDSMFDKPKTSNITKKTNKLIFYNFFS